MTKQAWTLAVLLALLGACAPPQDGGEPASETTAAAAPSEDVVVVYSGRNKSLIGPLLERYTGAKVEVRYAGTAELAATLLEEGDVTPCDLFIGQDAAALGALSARGLLKPLPEDVLARVPARYASPQGDWVGLSGRARTVVYNTERVRVEDLPQSLEEVGDERYRGRFGIAPVNASFQAHMAVYYAVHGAEATTELLQSIAANEPQRYPKNSPIVEAVLRGEIDWGLVNHYYLWRALKEDPDAPGANYLMPEGEVSSFVNLAGAGVIDDRPAVLDLVAFLVSDEAQRFFAEETYEYPLVEGVEASVDLEPLGEQMSGQIDFGAVSDALEPTLELIASTGVLQ